MRGKNFMFKNCILPDLCTCWAVAVGGSHLQGNRNSPRKPSPRGVRETAQDTTRQAAQEQWPHLALSPRDSQGHLLPKDKSPPEQGTVERMKEKRKTSAEWEGEKRHTQ
jgi:hypothetical protein